METIKSILASLHFDPILFGFQFVMFFVLHYSLKGLIYAPLLKSRNERDQKIGGKIAEAEAMAAQARALKDRYDAEIQVARQDAQHVLLEATKEAEAEKAAKVAAAREQARQLMEKAEADVAREREQAMAGLEGDIKTLSTSIVERLLEKTLEGPRKEAVLAKVRSAP